MALLLNLRKRNEGIFPNHRATSRVFPFSELKKKKKVFIISDSHYYFLHLLSTWEKNETCSLYINLLLNWQIWGQEISLQQIVGFIFKSQLPLCLVLSCYGTQEVFTAERHLAWPCSQPGRQRQGPRRMGQGCSGREGTLCKGQLWLGLFTESSGL